MRRPLATRRGRWWLPLLALPALVATGCEPAPAPTRFTYPRIDDQPVKVSEAQGEVIGKDLFTFGGFDATKPCCTPTNRAYAYHRGNGWRRLRNLPDRGITHAGMATDGRSIWYAGGYRADESWTGQIFGTRQVWRYDIATDTYWPMPKLPRVRAGGQPVGGDDAAPQPEGVRRGRTRRQPVALHHRRLAGRLASHPRPRLTPAGQTAGWRASRGSDRRTSTRPSTTRTS
jgi:hypothetical protein